VSIGLNATRAGAKIPLVQASPVQGQVQGLGLEEKQTKIYHAERCQEGSSKAYSTLVHL
jgi:hypothetical protein